MDENTLGISTTLFSKISYQIFTSWYKTLVEAAPKKEPDELLTQERVKEFYDLLLQSFVQDDQFLIYQFLEEKLPIVWQKNISPETVLTALGKLRALFLQEILNSEELEASSQSIIIKKVLSLFDNLFIFISRHHILESQSVLPHLIKEHSNWYSEIPAVLYFLEGNRFGSKGYISPFFEKLTGLRSKDIQSVKWEEIIYPEDLRNLKTFFNKQKKTTSTAYKFEYRLKTGSNTWIKVLETGRKIYHEDNKPPSYTGIIVPISPEEDLLTQSLIKIIKAIFSRKNKVVLVDSNFNILYSTLVEDARSKNAPQQGSTPSKKLSLNETLKEAFEEQIRILNKSRQKSINFYLRIKNSKKGSASIEFQLTKFQLSGDKFYYLITELPPGNSSLTIDPEDLLNRIQLLIETNRKLNLHLKYPQYFQEVLNSALELVPTAQAGSILIKQKDGYHFVAARGYDLKDLQKIVLFKDTEKQPFPRTAQEKMLKQGDKSVQILDLVSEARKILSSSEYLQMEKIGRIREIHQSISAVIRIKNKPFAILNIDNLDKTISFSEIDRMLIELYVQQVSVNLENKNLLDAVRDQEEKYRTLFESAPLAICIYQNDRFKLVNPQFHRFCGTRPEELPNFDFWELVDANDRRKMKKLLTNYVSKNNYNEARNLEFKITNRAGEERHLLGTFTIIPYEGDPAVLAEIMDITRLRNLEKQLIQAQKMETIGTLTAGIAHDFNNILGAIIPSAEMILAKPNSSDTVRHAELILRMAERAATLTRQMLAFARMDTLQEEVFDVNVLLQDIRNMLEKMLPKNIKLEYSLSPETLPFEGDKNQISQVIVNLIVNARDALPNGGKIQIKSGITEINEVNKKWDTNFRKGKYIHLSVVDNGTGIPAAIRSKIFDPFFTTKKIGKGTGLGLSTVYGIVKKHRGVILVKSREGKGSQFDIFLPISKKKPLVSHKQTAKKIVGGSGRILIVDDEDDLREIMQHMLESLGYEVYAANSGKEGIKILKTHHKEIDLLILDYAMPEMNGRETLEAMRKINPEIPAIICTGYGDQNELDKLLLIPDIELLTKPFSMEIVSHKIKEVLSKTKHNK